MKMGMSTSTAKMLQWIPEQGWENEGYLTIIV